jgi:enterobactin synthetase component D
MPTDGTQRKFLDMPQPIDTGAAQTLILHTAFLPDAYSDELFSAYNIAFPTILNAAVDKRKSEYLAGRTLVSHGFAQLNIPPQIVPSGEKRNPIWPAGVQGSITHSREYCACILTTLPDRFVGIDVEWLLSDNALRSVRHVAMSEHDITIFTSQSIFTEQHFATLLFSAKETLYKALYPIVQSFFGFDAATIHACPTEDQILLRLTQTLHPTLQEGGVFTIQYQQLGGKILTWLFHDASDLSGA